MYVFVFLRSKQQQMMPLVQMPTNNQNQYPMVHPGVNYPLAAQVGVPYRRNNIASEANLLRNEYLASGGSDPRLIQQMNDIIGQSLYMQQQVQPSFTANKHQNNSDQITLKVCCLKTKGYFFERIFSCINGCSKLGILQS